MELCNFLSCYYNHILNYFKGRSGKELCNFLSCYYNQIYLFLTLVLKGLNSFSI